jgi:hypothetical protein
MVATGFSEQQWLFDCGGVDLSALRVRRDLLRKSRRAVRTVRAYQSDWRSFDAWCARVGRVSMPALPETVELYVTWMLSELGRKVTTAERHVSAIAHLHREAGHGSPVRPPVREVLKGARVERRERPSGKAALDPLDLVSGFPGVRCEDCPWGEGPGHCRSGFRHQFPAQ